MPPFIDLLLWFATLSAGLMGGLYFAFSAFVMTALASLGRDAGVAAMNAINRVIVRSAFLPIFLLSSLACTGLIVMALMRLGETGMQAAAAGSAVYLVGMTGVTIAGNVPLNNMLAADPNRDGTWERYRLRWTRWNHLRTVASFVSLVLFIIAIAER